MDEHDKPGLIQYLGNILSPSKSRVFGEVQYEEINKTGKTQCPEENCFGDVKYVRSRVESYAQNHREETLFYRCTANCRHHWKVIKNSFYDKLIFQKY